MQYDLYKSNKGTEGYTEIYNNIRHWDIGRIRALWILERDDNNKKLQLEASSRVVHK